MVFVYDKLRGKIIEKYHSISNFAKEMKVSQSGIYTTIKMGKPFPANKIYEFAEKLDIGLEEIGIYFFSTKVSND